MTKYDDDNYPSVQARERGRAVKDVYLYSNDHQPTALCLSCAHERRREGAAVEMMSDKPAARKVRCRDCGE